MSKYIQGILTFGETQKAEVWYIKNGITYCLINPINLDSNHQPMDQISKRFNTRFNYVTRITNYNKIKISDYLLNSNEKYLVRFNKYGCDRLYTNKLPSWPMSQVSIFEELDVLTIDQKRPIIIKHLVCQRLDISCQYQLKNCSINSMPNVKNANKL